MQRCEDHSGCVERITGLERENASQWEGIKHNRDKIEAILMRVNVILGGMVVGCILLAINILINYSNGNK